MSDKNIVVRSHGEGERRWFIGGGVHVWKLTAEETDGAFFLFEDFMEQGKMTPLHRHPDASETLYLLEGTIVAHVDGAEHAAEAGAVVHFPKGIAHAFRVTSSRARILCVQAPGTGEPFYRAASEPTTTDSGLVDFARLGQLARESGAIEVLGPPPFAR